MTLIEAYDLMDRIVDKHEITGSENPEDNICIASVRASNCNLPVQEMTNEVKENMFQIFSKNLTETSHSDLLAICSSLLTDALCKQTSRELSMLCVTHKLGKP